MDFFRNRSRWIILFVVLSTAQLMSGRRLYAQNIDRAHDSSASTEASHTAQTTDQKQSKFTTISQYRISFRVNRSHIEEHYQTNKAILKDLRQTFLSSDGRPMMKHILLISTASPEGPFENNKRLAINRGEQAKRQIEDLLSTAGMSHDVGIEVRPIYENWAEFYSLAKSRYNRADSTSLFEILDDKSIGNERKKQLMRALGRASWRMICDSIMVDLRGVVCRIQFEEPCQPNVCNEEVVLAPHRSELPRIDFRVAPTEYHLKPFTQKATIALRSNLLYDALTWLNVGVEIPFAKGRFSVLYDHQFPWWRGGEGNNKFCMRYLQMSGEVRWWFHPRTKPSTRHQIVRQNLTGHFVGLYGMGGKWDFEHGRKICYQGEFWSAGFSYGYAMPIGRRLNLEFSLSVGYASIPYRHFIPSEDYEVLYRDPNDVGTWNYFGVTKVGVTLVVPLQFNRTKKGGRR